MKQVICNNNEPDKGPYILCTFSGFVKHWKACAVITTSQICFRIEVILTMKACLL